MEPEPQRQHVVVTDVSMPFGSMVRFLVKVSLAAIPAMVILFLIGAALSFAFGLIVMSWAPLMRGIGARPAAEKRMEERAEAEQAAKSRQAAIDRRVSELREQVAPKDEPAPVSPPVIAESVEPEAPPKAKTKHIIRTEFVIASSVSNLYHRAGCEDIRPEYTRVGVPSAIGQGIREHAACAGRAKDIKETELWY